MVEGTSQCYALVVNESNELKVVSKTDEKCVFWLASKKMPGRKLLIQLSAPAGFFIEEDPDGKLTGKTFESFEQVFLYKWGFCLLH